LSKSRQNVSLVFVYTSTVPAQREYRGSTTASRAAGAAGGASLSPSSAADAGGAISGGEQRRTNPSRHRRPPARSAESAVVAAISAEISSSSPRGGRAAVGGGGGRSRRRSSGAGGSAAWEAAQFANGSSHAAASAVEFVPSQGVRLLALHNCCCSCCAKLSLAADASAAAPCDRRCPRFRFVSFGSITGRQLQLEPGHGAWHEAPQLLRCR